MLLYRYKNIQNVKNHQIYMQRKVHKMSKVSCKWKNKEKREKALHIEKDNNYFKDILQQNIPM